MSDSIMVLQNHRGEWLFADWSIDEGTIFTLTDKHGDLIMHGALLTDLKTFEKAMVKSGFKNLRDPSKN
jgi:hypothetical protein